MEDFDYENGNYEGDEYRLDEVTSVPVTLIVASEDHICPVEQAELLAEQL